MIANSKDDLEYLDRFASEKPLLTVGGYIWGLSEELKKKVTLTIGSEKGKKKYAIEKNGNFKVVLPGRGTYSVAITLPARAEVWAKDGQMIFTDGIRVTTTPKETIIEYEVSFDDTFCSFRELDVRVLPDKENKHPSNFKYSTEQSKTTAANR